MRSVVAVSERVTTKHYTNAHVGLEFGDAPQPSWSLEVEVSASLLRSHWCRHGNVRVGAVVFRGLGRVFKSGFSVFPLNYMFKTGFKTGCFLMVLNQFWNRVLRIRIELRDQNEVQKYTLFNGLESVLGSGF